MNRFCPNLKNKKVKQEFDELIEAFDGDEAIAYYLWDANEGYSLDKAPDGADSKHFSKLLSNHNGDRKKALRDAGMYMYLTKLTGFDYYGMIKPEHFLDTDEKVTEWAKNIARLFFTLKRKKIEVAKKIALYNKARGTHISVDWNDKLAIPIGHANNHKLKAAADEGKKAIRKRTSTYRPDYNPDMMFGESRELDFDEDYLEDRDIERILDSLLPKSRINQNNKDASRSYNGVDYAIFKLTKFLGVHIPDITDISNINQSLDEVEFYIYNEYFQKTLPEQIKDATRLFNKAPEAVYIPQFLLDIKYALSTNKITGNWETDCNTFGEKTAKILDKCFPNLYLYNSNKEQYIGYIKYTVLNEISFSKKTHRATPYNKMMLYLTNNNKLYYMAKSKLTKYVNMAELAEKVPDLRSRILRRVLSDVLLYYGYKDRQRDTSNKHEQIVKSIRETKPNAVNVFNRRLLFPDGKSRYGVKETLNKISKLYPQYSQLCDRITKSLKGDAYIYISNEGESAAVGHTLSASKELRESIEAYGYNPVIILLNDDSWFFHENPIHVTIHEIIHAVTSQYLKDNSELKEAIENYIHRISNEWDTDIYGFKNAQEFVAEFFSNEDFRTELKQRKPIENNTFASLFHEILHKILSFIGVVESRSAFDQIAPIMELILDDSLTWSDLNQMSEISPRSIKSLADRFSIDNLNASLKTVEEQIIDKYNELYKIYRRKINKTKSQTKILDDLYKLMSELLKLRNVDNKLLVFRSLQEAIERIGIYNVGDVITPELRRRHVSHYLHDLLNKGYADITPDIIVELYECVIKFYPAFLSLLPNKSAAVRYDFYTSMTKDEQNAYNNMRNSLNNELERLVSIWKDAAMVVGDKIVDETVDKYVIYESDEHKESHKTIVKDWLHTNLYFGDITFFRWLANYQYSGSPVIKQMFLIIEEASQEARENYLKEAQPIFELFDKLDSIFRKFKEGPTWSRVFAEYDNDGLPTGYFIRPTNRGQFEKDQKEFMENLVKTFKSKYGYYYIEDEYGNLLRSSDEQPAEEETWEYDPVTNTWEMPKCYEWQLEIEKWICEHANRRYTYKYYKERFSSPYVYKKDDQNNVTFFHNGHGLSPKTYFTYQRIQSGINYYMNKCTDPNTGITRIEDLSDRELLDLEELNNQLRELSNPFDQYGNSKPSEEREMAYEILAWQAYSLESIGIDYDFDSYDNELRLLESEVASLAGDPNKINEYNNAVRKLDLFKKYNSSYRMNPFFLDWLFGDSTQDQNDNNKRARWLRHVLRQTVEDNNDAFNRQLDKHLNHIYFFLQNAEADRRVEDTKEKIDSELAKKLSENISTEPIYKVFGNNLYYNTKTGRYESFDPQNESDYLTYFDWYVEFCTNFVMQNGYLPGEQFNTIFISRPDWALLSDSQQKAEVLSNSMIKNVPKNYQAIKKYIVDKLSYTITITHKDQSQEKIQKPSTIFSITVPIHDHIVTPEGIEIPTKIHVPKYRFASKKNKKYLYYGLINDDYDNNNPDAIQPKAFDEFGNKLYDNSEDYNQIKGDLKVLYDMLVKTVADCIDSVSNKQNVYDYRLPQIEARTITMFSRIHKAGAYNTLGRILQSVYKVLANDYDLRQANDSSVANIPKRFVDKLNNPEFISLDVVGGTLEMLIMKHNFLAKTKRAGLIKTLFYNLGEEVRDKQDVKAGENQRNTAEHLIDAHLYEISNLVKFGSSNDKEMNAWIVAANKIGSKALSLAALWLLSCNALSFLGGGLASIASQFTHAGVDKHYSMRDLLHGQSSFLLHLPRIMRNVNNSIANCKETAMMQLNGMSPDYESKIATLQDPALRRMINYLGMEGFTMVDYSNNIVLMKAIYNNIRFYKGDNDLPAGFYSKYGFLKKAKEAGYSKKQANRMYHRMKTTLWDMYEYKDHIAVLKDIPGVTEYVTPQLRAQVATKIKNRSALFNGTSPINDRAMYRDNFFMGWIGAMRAWFLQIVLFNFAGNSNDFIIPEYEETIEPDIIGTKIKHKRKTKQRAMTEEERQQAYSFNYALGTSDDRIVMNIGKSIKTLIHKIQYHLIRSNKYIQRGKPIFSYDERKSWRYIRSWLISTVVLFMATTLGLKIAKTILTDLPGMNLNPVEWVQYNAADFVANILLRGFVSNLATFDVSTIMDMLKQMSVLNQSVEGELKAIGGLAGVVDYNYNDVVKSGSYLGETYAFRDFCRLTGFLDNIHTSTSLMHTRQSTKFYLNMYGYLFNISDYTKDLTPDVRKYKSNNLIERDPFDLQMEQMDRQLDKMDEQLDRMDERLDAFD